MVKHSVLRQLLLVVVGFLLVEGIAKVATAQHSDAHRDRKTNDFFGRKNEFRRDQGHSRLRLPIEIQRFRTIDGTFNNIAGIYWGSAGSLLRRRVPSDYQDGVSIPSGGTRKPARSISNYMCNQNASIPNNRQMSSMVWQWGQFLDHDLDLTETAEPLESFPIVVTTGDRYFYPFGAGGQTIEFFRSEYRNSIFSGAAREQVNSITSWIDGSNVYGSDDTTARSLRTLQRGLMKTSDGNMLPIDDEGFFLAGDVRANEQVGLTAMHTIFVREHNRIAQQYANRYPYLTDQQIYVRARKHVTGVIQAITYNEFIPALMGNNALRPYRGYNPLVYPNISNVFATAAYRFGHSMLDSEIWRMDNFGTTLPEGNLALRDAFFSPDKLRALGVDPYLKGLTMQQAQEIDCKVVTEVRSFLFGQPGSGGFDLPALNIQRGRDHGLADFNSVRKFYRLEPYKSFDEITGDLQVQFSLSQAYNSVDDIDSWVGMLAEDHVNGASIGETLFIIFQQQFEMLRDSDRFWYERDFSGKELDLIRSTTLADVIYRNSGVRNMMPNIFFVPPVQ